MRRSRLAALGDRRVPTEVADQVEAVVTRAIEPVVGQAEGSHVKALKGALADAQKKMAEGSGQA